MEAAVVGVATGVMKPLLSKLADLLKGEYAKHKSMRKNIKFLHDELSEMTRTLEMLADEEHLNPQMKAWRDNLREMAYDIEDCVDAFKARAGHGGANAHNLREMAYDIEDCVDAFKARAGHGGANGFKGLVRKMRNLKLRHNRKIGNEIKELMGRVIDASERHKRYKFVPSAHKSNTSSVDPRLPALYEDIKNLVAIDGPKKEIIDLLNIDTKSSSIEVKVVSIYGCGGLGKTTLANQVYGSIKSQFSCSAFVSVSQNPNITKILRDIAEGVGFSYYKPDDDVKQLIDKLRGHLRDKRYLVVIDDIWDAAHWEIIGLALLSNDCGSKIITTTRNVKVAEFSSSQGGSVYEMKPLSPADSKMLLFKRAFGSEKPQCPQLENIPDKILGKCGGLPLAIITISSMLANKYAKDEWDRVLKAIGSALAKNRDAEKMTTILSLSYTAIPHHLRTCLLYLSLFPEDYVIKKKCLINRWIAEGFIQKGQEQRLYETGEIYFNELINRCMIQPVNVEYDQAEACRVHDIILDYIKCKANDENFVTALYDSKDEYTSEYKVRRLCIKNHNGEKGSVTVCVQQSLSHIRSLTICGHPVWASLEPFTVLRVLECDSIEDHHLRGVEKLIHLKYLCLRSHKITNLPEKIGELQHLQTLDVQDTNIKELPLTITKLQRLAHLYVGWGTNFPEGMIEQMESLEEISQYGVKSYKQAMSLQEFSKLTKLRTLEIYWESNLGDGREGIIETEDIRSSLAGLLSSCNLHDLSIVGSFRKLFPQLSRSSATPCSLQKLCFEHCHLCEVPNWMGSLGNLQMLKLQILCVRPGDVEILGAMPSLLFLELETAGGMKGRIIVQGSNIFRELKYFFLQIWVCGTSLEFEAGSMPKLEHLKLCFPVHHMECLNDAYNFGIPHLSALSKAEVIIQCHRNDEYNYDPDIEYVASTIQASVMTLPKRPTLNFRKEYTRGCRHFDCVSAHLEFFGIDRSTTFSCSKSILLIK
ncbi:hypothetical protein ACP4OV_029346 [Aristida adscensionis]